MIEQNPSRNPLESCMADPVTRPSSPTTTPATPPFHEGQVVTCLDDDAPCWFLVRDRDYIVDHCQLATDGNWYVFLHGFARGWPAEQFKPNNTDVAIWPTWGEQLRM